MAVTKIRKISSWVLILCTIISVAVLGLFIFGGDDAPLKEDLWTPTYTGTFLYWMYTLLGLSMVSAILAGIWQFIVNFKANPKKGATGLIVIVAFAGLLLVTYTIGDTTPVYVLNSEAQAFNTPGWLKISDMWLFSTYALTALVILAIIGGSLKKIFDKK